MKYSIILLALCVALTGCSQKEKQEPVEIQRRPGNITGQTGILWTDTVIGSIDCADGVIRDVQIGFREDGVIVWRIDATIAPSSLPEPYTAPAE